MSNNVFVFSEWLPKAGREDDVVKIFQTLSEQTEKEEADCVRAIVLQQIEQADLPCHSKFSVICMQEYRHQAAFEAHRNADYVKQFFKTYLADKSTSPIEDWRCRLFASFQ